MEAIMNIILSAAYIYICEHILWVIIIGKKAIFKLKFNRKFILKSYSTLIK